MREIHPFAFAVYFFHLVLLFPSLPLWLAAIAAVASFTKVLFIRRGDAYPPRFLSFAIGCIVLSLAMIEAPRIWHRDTFASLVTISSLMILWDRPNRQQIMLLHGSFFALLLCLLVVPSSKQPAFIYFLLTILIFFSLVLHHLPPQSLFSLVPLSRHTLKLALPVAAILLPVYFYFPELRQERGDTAITGLSNYLAPGRLARLSQSQRLAFRAKFDSEIDIATLQNAYWRVGILEENLGMVWRRSTEAQEEALVFRPQAAELVYRIIPESRLRGHLPLLEHTVYVNAHRQVQEGVYWQADARTFRSRESIIEIGASPADNFRPRQPPAPPNPEFARSTRVDALVKELSVLPPEQKIESLMALFSQFRYTLEPGLLGDDDPLDQFLFETRSGFCEHFAAAFASLMQLSGTPARVVTGFTGGRKLGDSDFVVVLDADAHAWAEVWLESQWQRIDPTEVVPGSQVERSQQHFFSLLPGAWLSFWSRIAAHKLSVFLQNIEVLWLIVMAIGPVMILVLSLRLLRRRKLPAWEQEFARLLRQLRRRGYHRQRTETVHHFFMRVAEDFPDMRGKILEVVRVYNRSMYGQHATGEQEFKRLLQNLRRHLHLGDLT
ncbi:MAG: transglutaminase TgpA family protein [Oligoflexus sp.]